MYFIKLVKSFFMNAVAISMACTLMVVERFWPLANWQSVMMRREIETTNIFFILQRSRLLFSQKQNNHVKKRQSEYISWISRRQWSAGKLPRQSSQ